MFVNCHDFLVFPWFRIQNSTDLRQVSTQDLVAWFNLLFYSYVVGNKAKIKTLSYTLLFRTLYPLAFIRHLSIRVTNTEQFISSTFRCSMSTDNSVFIYLLFTSFPLSSNVLSWCYLVLVRYCLTYFSIPALPSLGVELTITISLNLQTNTSIH